MAIGRSLNPGAACWFHLVSSVGVQGLRLEEG